MKTLSDEKMQELANFIKEAFYNWREEVPVRLIQDTAIENGITYETLEYWVYKDLDDEE